MSSSRHAIGPILARCRGIRRALGTALLLAGCAGPVNEHVLVPVGSFGAGAQEPAAADLAAYVFADTARTAGQPAEAARAVAAIEYLAARLDDHSRTTAVPAAALPAGDRDDLLLARRRLRAALGIAPTAASQTVVDGLLAAAAALSASDQAGARTALPAPVFPPDIVERLSALPYIWQVNAAAKTIQNDLAQFGDAGR